MSAKTRIALIDLKDRRYHLGSWTFWVRRSHKRPEDTPPASIWTPCLIFRRHSQTSFKTIIPLVSWKNVEPVFNRLIAGGVRQIVWRVMTEASRNRRDLRISYALCPAPLC